jgi:hypothetical protein
MSLYPLSRDQSTKPVRSAAGPRGAFLSREAVLRAQILRRKKILEKIITSSLDE